MLAANYVERKPAGRLTSSPYPTQSTKNIEIQAFSTIDSVVTDNPYYMAPESQAEGILAFLADEQIYPLNFPATTISNQLHDAYRTILGIGTTTNVNLRVRRAAPIFKDSIVTKFRALSAEWKSSRNLLSSGTEMFMHPAYQKIIGMGQDVVPLIFSELEKNIDHWFWALKAITEADPVPPAHRGRLGHMAADWLRWAKTQGYEW